MFKMCVKVIEITKNIRQQNRRHTALIVDCIDNCKIICKINRNKSWRLLNNYLDKSTKWFQRENSITN